MVQTKNSLDYSTMSRKPPSNSPTGIVWPAANFQDLFTRRTLRARLLLVALGISLLSLLSPREAAGQWYKQFPPTSANLYDVNFADRDNGWIVGDSGTILHTTDDGLTWQREWQGGTLKQLRSVKALSKNTCWAVGVDTLVVK